MDARQLPLPLESLATRDEAYGAAIDSAALPAAAKRVARWMLETGHPQVTDQGERLYAVAEGSERKLAARSGIPHSTIQRGLAALAATRPNPLLWRARGCLCLVATWLCELDTTASDVVPQAPTDDWGRITLPRRSPERPTAGDTCPRVPHLAPGLPQGAPPCPRSAPGCPTLPQADPSSISARAPVVVVDFLPNNNNPPDQAAVKDLARATWAKLHGERRHPPRPEHAERLLLLRCAWLALGTELGARWLLSAARARPLRGERQDPLRFFQAAAAYQAWERLAGEPAETDEERRQARRQFRELLAQVDLPRELLQRGGAP